MGVWGIAKTRGKGILNIFRLFWVADPCTVDPRVYVDVPSLFGRTGFVSTGDAQKRETWDI